MVFWMPLLFHTCLRGFYSTGSSSGSGQAKIHRMEEPPAAATKNFDAVRIAVTCLTQYKSFARDSLQIQRQQAKPLLSVLPEVGERLSQQLAAANANADFIAGILETTELTPEHIRDRLCQTEDERSAVDVTVSGIMRQAVREWSADGKVEREQCMGLALSALKRLLPPSADVRVTVPGAGLGRLVWECAMAGYDAVGIEAALTFIYAGDYIVNRLLTVGQSTEVYPFAAIGEGPNNVFHAKDLSRAIQLPDDEALSMLANATKDWDGVDGDSHPHSRLSVRAGNFGYLARRFPGESSAVLTCFYIDACGDVPGSVSAVHTSLRSGGLWINCGPLEYEGTEGGHSMGKIRLCGEEVLRLVERSGFEMLQCQPNTTCAYTQDKPSMFQAAFGCLFFVARKK
jgi:hypothetical protein